MDQVTPRLHSEFFTLRLRIEDFLRSHFSDQIFQPLLNAAIAKYVEERRHPFRHYLLEELMRSPQAYHIVGDTGLENILSSE